MDQNHLLRDRRLYVIFAITLVGVMGVASITPALPKIAHTLNLTKQQVGLLISAFTFPGIFLTPVAGILADRLGRKTIIVPALFIFAIGGSAIFFVHQFHYIILLRVLQGIGAAPLGSLNATLIADYFKGKQRPEAMGYNASVLSLSTASYPLVGGALASIAWFYPFILPLLAIPAGFIVLYGIPEPEVERPSSFKAYFKGIFASLMKREIIGLFILGALTFIILYGAFLTYIPFLLEEKFGMPTAKIGIFISVSSFTTAIIATQVGKLTSKYGSLALLKSAFLLYFAVSLLIPFMQHMVILLLPIMLFGAAQALNIPSLTTMLANYAPENQRGVFLSLNGMMLRVGQTLGPMVIGIGYMLYDLRGAYFLAAIVALVGFGVLSVMFRKGV